MGRLRGEITLSHFLTRSFREQRRNALQSLVLYTQDEWKAKEPQVAQFTKEDGRKFAGRRLIDVPDPVGCHANWVEHFWQDFGGVLDRFAPGIRIVTTTDTYRNPEMQALVRDLASRAEEVRATVNKYRTRHPYPPGWIPFEAFCEKCGTIGATTTGIEGMLASYQCERCGHRGKSSIEKGKLNWRLEWPALWKVYQVDIEPEERGSVAARMRTANSGRAQMLEFFGEMLQRRRKEPGEDLISILLESEVDGERLEEFDILTFCFLLILAGNETTRNGISGGLQTLCEHPLERARLQADMSLIDRAVDEMLRWTSPLHHMSRRATAANRDEDVFDDPYRFDVTRRPNEHLAFGHHEHFCLGAGFARKEIKVMFEELFRRFPNIQLDGPPERLRSNFINGIKRMPVSLT